MNAINWVRAALEGARLIAEVARGAMQARRLDKSEEKLKRIQQRQAANRKANEEALRRARGES